MSESGVFASIHNECSSTDAALGHHLGNAAYTHCALCVSVQQVISAQQLPKLNKDKHKSIVDPLVRVEIYGVPADSASKETHHIENNGEYNTHKQAHTSTYKQTRMHTIRQMENMNK